MSDIEFIFVHGLAGWGSYEKTYRRMPYLGLRGGDLIAFLRKQGFRAYAASVAPAGSAWDRACELYAQLAGLITDYGAAHSTEYRHKRFGRDFSGRPLIPEWGAGYTACSARTFLRRNDSPAVFRTAGSRRRTGKRLNISE